MTTTNDSIEQSETKQQVREEIVNQIVEWATRLRKKKINILTLPGIGWHFENELVKACKKKGIEVSGVGFEYNANKPRIWDEMNSNCPDGFEAANKSIHGWSDKESRKFDVAWFDFCGYPDRDRMETVKEFMRSHPVCLVYATFSLAIREHGGAQQMATEIFPFGNSVPSVAVAVRKRLWFDVRFHNENEENVKEIMHLMYAGGERQVTAMITLGYQSGKVKHLTPFDADWDTPLREQRKQEQKARTDAKIRPPITDDQKAVVIKLIEEEQTRVAKILADIEAKQKELEDTPFVLDTNDFIRHFGKQGWSNKQILECFKQGAIQAVVTATLVQRVIPSASKIAAVTNCIK